MGFGSGGEATQITDCTCLPSPPAATGGVANGTSGIRRVWALFSFEAGVSAHLLKSVYAPAPNNVCPLNSPVLQSTRVCMVLHGGLLNSGPACVTGAKVTRPG